MRMIRSLHAVTISDPGARPAATSASAFPQPMSATSPTSSGWTSFCRRLGESIRVFELALSSRRCTEETAPSARLDASHQPVGDSPMTIAVTAAGPFSEKSCLAPPTSSRPCTVVRPAALPATISVPHGLSVRACVRPITAILCVGVHVQSAAAAVPPAPPSGGPPPPRPLAEAGASVATSIACTSDAMTARTAPPSPSGARQQATMGTRRGRSIKRSSARPAAVVSQRRTPPSTEQERTLSPAGVVARQVISWECPWTAKKVEAPSASESCAA